ncbi:hypothetical protein D3C86_1808210 [compost metagenome]
MVLGDITGDGRRDAATENLADADYQAGGGGGQRRWNRLAGQRPDGHADHAEVEKNRQE